MEGLKSFVLAKAGMQRALTAVEQDEEALLIVRTKAKGLRMFGCGGAFDHAVVSIGMLGWAQSYVYHCMNDIDEDE